MNEHIKVHVIRFPSEIAYRKDVFFSFIILHSYILCTINYLSGKAPLFFKFCCLFKSHWINDLMTKLFFLW